MRIVAGTARGRTLLGPKRARDLRPTADRVRETLFNVLGQWLDGVDVLDLYAGTGALALEALSRGAARAVLVDSGKEAVDLCRRNAAALGFAEQARVLALPADVALERLEREGARFGLVFADPPYAARVLERIVSAAERLLAPGGVVCIEHDKREPAPERVGNLGRSDQRRFGDTSFSLYRAS